jgi:hypothetical protein
MLSSSEGLVVSAMVQVSLADEMWWGGMDRWALGRCMVDTPWRKYKKGAECPLSHLSFLFSLSVVKRGFLLSGISPPTFLLGCWVGWARLGSSHVGAVVVRFVC